MPNLTLCTSFFSFDLFPATTFTSHYASYLLWHAFLPTFLPPVDLLFRSFSFTFSLCPPSSFPRGYYLSQRQICPIINPFSSLSRSLSFSHAHSHTRTHTSVYRDRSRGTNTFTQTQTLLFFTVYFTQSHTQTHTHLSLLRFCHTLKSQLYTFPPFSPLSCHHPTNLH